MSTLQAAEASVIITGIDDELAYTFAEILPAVVIAAVFISGRCPLRTILLTRWGAGAHCQHTCDDGRQSAGPSKTNDLERLVSRATVLHTGSGEEL